MTTNGANTMRIDETVKTKQEAIDLAMKLTGDVETQKSLIQMMDLMPSFIMGEDGSKQSLVVAGPNGVAGSIRFDA